MTDDDELLGAVRDHVRRERAEDAVLEAVARGETDKPGERSPELAAMVSASAPLGDAFEAALAARIVSERAKAMVSSAPPAPAPVPKTPARVTWLRRVSPWIGPAALAAAVVLYVGTRGAAEDDGPALPEYTTSARGDQSLRGTPAESPAAAPRLRTAGKESSFEILLRPSVSAEERMAAWPFTVSASGDEPTPLLADVEVSKEGAVRIRGKGGALDGAREIRVVLAAARSAKFDAAAASAREGHGNAHMRVVVVGIDR